MTTAVAAKEPTVAELAIRALHECRGDVQQAKRRLEHDLGEEFRQSTMASLFDGYLNDRVMDAMRSGRRKFWRDEEEVAGKAGGPSEAAIVRARNRLLVAAEHSLLNYPLAGGKALGDADRAEVLTQAVTHEALAEANAIRGKWFRLIAKAIPDGVKVRDALDHARLEALQRQAEAA